MKEQVTQHNIPNLIEEGVHDLYVVNYYAGVKGRLIENLLGKQHVLLLSCNTKMKIMKKASRELGTTRIQLENIDFIRDCYDNHKLRQNIHSYIEEKFGVELKL